MAARSGIVLLLACAAACAPAGAAVPAVPAPAPAPGAKAGLLDRLGRLNRSPQFLFGQENATLWGMYLDGGLAPTNKWFERTAAAGRFTSDSAALVGDDPAVLGVSLGMLAFEPTGWNRRAVVAEAIRRQIAQGGVVTMDWHAPSCDAAGPSAGSLGTVMVGGHEVVIQALAGGSSFYADEEYTRPITSRADVPETLKCVCQIANDLPLTAGAYKGTTGKTWLVAQAKHAAQVMRDQRLSGLPIIVRPFHEHTGSWFWWGQPYWNCAALLGKPDAVSGPEAFKTMTRDYVSALRAEPGMGELVFAYSPDKVLGPGEAPQPVTQAQHKVEDPTGFARDRLRKRLVGELEAAGLAYVSPAQRGATSRAPPSISGAKADAYVAQRRAYYAEGYAGDDVFDVLGIDLYHPIVRAANRADLRLFGLQLRVLAEEARARSKPYALTEAGTYRLQLAQLGAGTPRGRPVTINGKKEVDEALARLFDPADRAALLRNFGLRAPGPIVLGAAERAAALPSASEDWFNQQLLVLAKQAKVAYALVWQTYFDSAWRDHYFYYYVPYPGHPDADAYRHFHADAATCFLHDACAVEPAPGSAVPAAAPPAAKPAVNRSPGDLPVALALAPTPESYLRLAEATEASLHRDVLDVWFPRSVDNDNGGFHEDFSRQWGAAPARDGRFSVFQARMTWLPSQIAMLRPALKDRFLPIARHGFDYLANVLWDKQDGGFFWGLDEQGHISKSYTDGKHLYGNSYCLFALAGYYQSTHDPAALALAKRAFRWMDQHAHDAKNGGYFEWLTRAGKPVTAHPETGKIDLIPVAEFPVGYKSMNTHLHLLEAFAQLYTVWKDETVRRRLEEVLAVLRDKISAPPGVMNLYLTNDWVALPGHDSYGHDIETAYLMLEAEDVLGRGRQPKTARMARMLVDHALAYGWDQGTGSFYRDGTTYGPPEDKQKEWWVEVEGLNALLLMHETYGQSTDVYWKAFLRQWQFIVDHQTDPEFHGLYEMIDADGHPVPGGKGRIWKEAYHEGRALLNVTARLRKLARATPAAQPLTSTAP